MAHRHWAILRGETKEEVDAYSRWSGCKTAEEQHRCLRKAYEHFDAYRPCYGHATAGTGGPGYIPGLFKSKRNWCLSFQDSRATPMPPAGAGEEINARPLRRVVAIF